MKYIIRDALHSFLFYTKIGMYYIFATNPLRTHTINFLRELYCMLLTFDYKRTVNVETRKVQISYPCIFFSFF